jgi:glutamate-1-semialdehyde 2,1-aminomutase
MSNWKRTQSLNLFKQAQTFFPGGVNSPVRAFGGVGGEPLFIQKARGAYLWDVDDNSYVDYVGSWGPAILGHAHPEVLAAIHRQMENGLTFGAPSEIETQLATVIRRIHPHMQMMRFVSSGTEACMAALRAARGATGRDKILKFEGCYHGHADCLLVKPGSGAATFGIPGSSGVPEGTVKDTLTVHFNDESAVEEVFAKHPGQIAAVIVEPIVGNAGFIRPSPTFLKMLREITSQHGSILIFDEVMTGFRVRLGGVQELSGVTPDMTTLGKVIGGGMPLAAYGGTSEIMSKVAPLGGVYQAGTLSGNPVAVSAGLKTLELLESTADYRQLDRNSRQLAKDIGLLAAKFKIPFNYDAEGGMFGFFFSDQPVHNFADAKKSNIQRFQKFFWVMLENGVYLAPSAYEANFLSFAHGEQELAKTLVAAEKALAAIANG